MIGAFLIGLLGSFHCVGMCGPIMITLTKGGGSAQSFVVYHASRLFVYATFGLVFGLFGVAFDFFGSQQFASIFIGITLIVIYSFPKWKNKLEGYYYTSSIYSYLKRKITPFYNTRFKWVGAGVINGLLPCGLVYLALAGAMMQTSVYSSIAYMLLFGLGTLPALIFVSFMGNHIAAFTRKFPHGITLVALSAGFIMVLRGLIIQSPDLNELMTAHLLNAMTYCGF